MDLYADGFVWGRGRDIVYAKVRAYRRLGDEALDTTIVMVRRFTGDKVTG